jgi:hypothetical protein
MLNSPNNKFLQYASLASQLLVGLGLATWFGKLLDEKRTITAIPLWIWILPMIVLLGMLIKLIKDTSKK